MIERPVLAYIGLGSNLAEPRRQILDAFAELDAIPGSRLTARSSLYRSPPLGPPDQPDYINAVAALETALHAEALLDQLQRIEQRHHRVRGIRWGPRTLDLDLLLYGEQRICTARLSVPHPGISQRAFVLVPLCEIAGTQLALPGLEHSGELLARLDPAELEALERMG